MPDQNPPASGFIPASQALAEADPESLADLLSRSPFSYTGPEGRAKRDRIVSAYRDLRAKFEAAEASGARAPRQPKALESQKSLESKASSTDMGF